MDNCKRKDTLAKLLIALYIVLTIAFLIESALPGEISSIHSLPFVKFFASMRIEPTLKLESGDDVTEAKLLYDTDDDTGTLLRVIPGGASKVVSVISENPEVIYVAEFNTASQGRLWLMSANGVGTAKINVTVQTQEVTKSKIFELSVTEGDLTPKVISSDIKSSSGNIVAGDSVTFSLDTEGDDSSSRSTVIWGSNNQSVLSVSHWVHGGASATFSANMAGSATVYAKNYKDGSIVASLKVTVVKSDEATFSINDDNGLPISETDFVFDSSDGIGELKRINIIGASGVRYQIIGDDILRIVRYATETQTHYYIRTLAVGSTTIMVQSKDDASEIYYTVNISEADLNPLPSDMQFSTGNKTITVGEYLTVGVTGADGHPVCWKPADDSATLYSLDIAKGSATFRVEKAGDITLVCFDPLKNEIIDQFTVTSTEKPIATSWQQFSNLVRKTLGHFSWCAAMGFILILALKKRLPTSALAILSLTQAALISACSELIQSITPGRVCTATDMFINFAGYLSGISLAVILIAFLNNHAWRKRGASELKNDGKSDSDNLQM